MPEIDPASRKILLPLPDRDDRRTRSHARGGVFRQILRIATTVAAAAIPGAGPAIGAVASAVGRDRAPLLGSIGGASETLQYLELQREIERESRLYEAASNVMKARHDAAMSSIRNIKS